MPRTTDLALCASTSRTGGDAHSARAQLVTFGPRGSSREGGAWTAGKCPHASRCGTRRAGADDEGSAGDRPHDQVLRAEPRRGGVPPGGPRGLRSRSARCSRKHPELRRSRSPRADLRARAADHLPRAVGRTTPARCRSTAASAWSSTPRSAPTRAACGSTPR